MYSDVDRVVHIYRKNSHISFFIPEIKAFFGAFIDIFGDLMYNILTPNMSLQSRKNAFFHSLQAVFYQIQPLGRWNSVVTRQDLEDYRKHSVFIDQQIQKLRQWNDNLTRLRTSSGIIRSNDADMRKRYDEMESGIKELIAQTTQTISDITKKTYEIEAALSSIPDPNVRAVMYQRYVLNAEWDDLAAILDISRRSAYRLHKSGCDYIENLG